MSFQSVQALRWSARILGFIIVALLLLFFAGEPLPEFAGLTAREILLFSATFGMVAGLILAYRWELPGGLLTLTSYVLFASVEHNPLPGPIFPVFLLVSLLYLVYWWSAKRSKR